MSMPTCTLSPAITKIHRIVHLRKQGLYVLSLAGSAWGSHPASTDPVTQEDKKTHGGHAGRHGGRDSRLLGRDGGDIWFPQFPETRHRAHEVSNGHADQPRPHMQRPAAQPPRLPRWYVSDPRPSPSTAPLSSEAGVSAFILVKC